MKWKMESHQTRSTLPDGGSIGRDQKGRYRTAALKEYPSGFCRALAHVIHEHVASRVTTGPLHDCPEDVMRRFQCLVGPISTLLCLISRMLPLQAHAFDAGSAKKKCCSVHSDEHSWASLYPTIFPAHLRTEQRVAIRWGWWAPASQLNCIWNIPLLSGVKRAIRPADMLFQNRKTRSQKNIKVESGFHLHIMFLDNSFLVGGFSPFQKY